MAAAAHAHEIRSIVNDLKFRLSDEALAHMPDFEARLRVLTTLGFLENSDRTISLKGRVACEVNSADELLATELLFRNHLSVLSPQEVVALLSAFVFQDKTDSDDQPCVPDALSEAMTITHELALELGDLQQKCGVDLPPEDYVNTILR